jgi:hypothetical protein
MKNHLLWICLMAASTAFATVHTVSNSPANVAQFNNIQAAIDAAAAGDTILVHGSPNAYAAFTINNKKLAIIGPGYAADKNLSQPVVVPGFTITGADAENSEIQGLYVTNTVTISSNRPNNLSFRRNRFSGNFFINITQGVVTYTGYLFESNYFEGSVISGVTNSSYENFIFRNNVFFESVSFGYQIAGFTNSTNVLFDHNIFLAGTNVRSIFSGNCRFLLFTNNIFVRRNAATNLSASTFNNNLTFNAGENAPWTVNENTNGGGNVSNQNPNMVDQAAIDAGTPNPLHNYSIVSGPAKGTGTGGRDMGVRYDNTGPLNWANGRNSRLPRIFSMNLNSIDVQAGGTLNVQIQGRRSN